MEAKNMANPNGLYKTILVTLEISPTDQAVLEHIQPLARMCGSKLILLHVADGWAARHFKEDAVSREVTEDKKYLADTKKMLEDQGFEVEVELAFGEPAKEIIKWVQEKHCDLLAMSTHGHKWLADMFLGTTVHHVRHEVEVPILLVRAKPEPEKK